MQFKCNLNAIFEVKQWSFLGLEQFDYTSALMLRASNLICGSTELHHNTFLHVRKRGVMVV